MKLALYLTIILLELIQGSIVQFNNQSLLPEQIYIKKRFIFSNSVSENNPGFMKFGLDFQSVNFQESVNLHMFFANSTTTDTLLMSTYTRQVCVQNDKGQWVLSSNITNLEMMFSLSEPIKKDEVRSFESTVQILDSGNFYFLIMYCPHKLDKIDKGEFDPWRFSAEPDDP
jgi:hypothetical protein